MTLADSLKPALHAIRAIPGQLGIRPYTVTAVIRRLDGAHGLQGAESEIQRVDIREAGGQPPKVRFANDEELALGGIGKGSITVGPITPNFTGGGTSFDVLVATAAQDHDLVHFEVTGPQFPTGAKFRLVDAQSDRALRYMLRLEPIGAMPEAEEENGNP